MGRRARPDIKTSHAAVTLPFRIESEAAAELEEAAAWYEKQRIGLGRELLDAVNDALTFIARWPRAGAAVPDVPPDVPVRRVPVRRFPYHVVYLEMADAIRILAFAHDGRSPGYWHSRAEP
jgi:toxin ParE1/3/4